MACLDALGPWRLLKAGSLLHLCSLALSEVMGLSKLFPSKGGGRRALPEGSVHVREGIAGPVWPGAWAFLSRGCILPQQHPAGYGWCVPVCFVAGRSLCANARTMVLVCFRWAVRGLAEVCVVPVCVTMVSSATVLLPRQLHRPGCGLHLQLQSQLLHFWASFLPRQPWKRQIQILGTLSPMCQDPDFTLAWLSTLAS